jgi:methyl-accepting chemotaxis protein
VANPDGSVLIHIDLDDKESVSRLKQLERRIETLNNKIYYKKQDRLPIEKQVSELGVALDQAKGRLEELRSASAGDEAIKDQEATVKAMQTQFDQADNALKRIDKSIEDGTRELSRMSDEAGRLAGIVAGVKANAAGLAGETEQAASASGANADATAQAAAAAGGAADNLERAGAAAAEATGKTEGLSDAMKEADKRADKFTKRIMGLAKRVFVFSLITSGLRAVRDWFGKVYQTNDQATAAVGRLKGALMAMVQPLVNVFIPVFTRLVNLLTTLASYGATITATLFGTTAEKSAQAAKGLQSDKDSTVVGVDLILIPVDIDRGRQIVVHRWYFFRYLSIRLLVCFISRAAVVSISSMMVNSRFAHTGRPSAKAYILISPHRALQISVPRASLIRSRISSSILRASSNFSRLLVSFSISAL